MDTELKRLAALALSNALSRDLTELSAAYIAAAPGLDADDVLRMAMSHADELLCECRAVDVHVIGKKVFHRECGGLWQYVEGTSSGS